MTTQIQSLIKEARQLSESIDADTARLVEVVDLLIALRKVPPVFSEFPPKEGC